MRAGTLLLSACGLALVAAGCGGSDDGRDSRAESPSPKQEAAAPKPAVRFVTPRNGATVGRSVTIRVQLSNFRIAPNAVGQAPRPGEGHLHFRLDEGKFDYPRFSGENGLIGKKLGVNGHYSPALAPTITYRKLPPGRHELQVYLANNNHTDVGVEAKAEFTVR